MKIRCKRCYNRFHAWKMNTLLAVSRTCRYCGYSGGGWPDSGECPSCGEVN